MKRKLLTFTNIIVLVATIVYILNLFVVSPDTGSMAIQITEALKAQNYEMNSAIKLFCQIFGFWGGHVNDLLGFHLTKVLSGEVWRIYTVVVTHAHLPHFLMNMAALIIAGNHIEKKIGTKKTILLFLVLMIVNNFVTDFFFTKVLANEATISYGASGWITSLFGMIITSCMLNKGYYKKELSKGGRIYCIIYFILTTFVLARNDFTMTAHISGVLAGMLAGYILETKFKTTKKTKKSR